MRGKSSAVAVLGALLLAGGCGGSDDAAPRAESVEAAIFQGGIQQNVRCEPAPELEAPAGEAAVFRCSFEEEEDVSGAMRMLTGCYVLEDGELRDVTRELPAGTVCSLTGS